MNIRRLRLVAWSKECVMSETKCLMVFFRGDSDSALVWSGIKRPMDSEH